MLCSVQGQDCPSFWGGSCQCEAELLEILGDKTIIELIDKALWNLTKEKMK